VSVVATGIEAEVGAQPQPAKVFTFPARQAAPAAQPATATESTAEDGEEPSLIEETDSDELLLDAEDILTPPVTSAPIAPPEDEDSADQPSAAAGGTLFERMSNIARGAPKAQIDEDETGYQPIDIPRFLNRQNNQ
jgi:cell division protein FtsZ